MNSDNLAHKIDNEINLNNELLNFLDYTVLLLSQVNSSQEIDLIMDDFRSTDLINILSENRELFGVLGAVWLTTFKRVFIENKEQDFPLKVLEISSLFKKLEWDKNCVDLATSLHRECLMLAVKNYTLTNLLLVLFIEGIILPYDTAIDNFQSSIENLIETEEDRSSLAQLIEDIKTLGWDF